MTKTDWSERRRRWIVVASGLGASIVPAWLLAAQFAEPTVSIVLNYWVEILVGPLKYWLPILMGHPSRYAVHPMSGMSIWIYLTCLLVILAHLVTPRLVPVWMVITGFCIWYGLAFLAIAVVEY